METSKKLYKGINNDFPSAEQPKGTYNFALNAISKELTNLEIEEGDKICHNFPDGYIPIGKKPILNGDIVYFLAHPNGGSEIGVGSVDCTYTTHVNSLLLNLRLTNQVDVEFSLRRGCERVLYFVDGLNKPRFFNLDKPENFQTLGAWDIDKFNLQKNSKSNNKIVNWGVVSGGSLKAGSYNFAIQYLDENLSGTEFKTLGDTFNIYHDSTSKDFGDVRGSSNEETVYRKFGLTNKKIIFDLLEVDTSFPFYRIAVLEATNGSGNVGDVFYTTVIPTETLHFEYTGNEALERGTREAVQQAFPLISTAKHIEQLENRLILSNLKGSQEDFCSFQACASQITTNLITEEVTLNDIDSVNNAKRQVKHLEKVGYMPGEIYSFDIVFVMDDGSESPPFHIPGRNRSYPSDMSYDNEILDTYSNLNDCGSSDFWGYDSQGENLLGQPIRHHRFPLRSEVSKPLFTKTGGETPIVTDNLYIQIEGNINLANVTDSFIDYVVDYTKDSVPLTVTKQLDVTNYDPDVGLRVFIDNGVGVTLVGVGVDEMDGGVPVNPLTYSELSYGFENETHNTYLDNIVYKTEIFGINFSNIKAPNNRVVGYFIVRAEREDYQKTILDGGVVLPTTREARANLNKYVSGGFVSPLGANIQEDVFQLIHPEFKFHNKEYGDTTKLLHEGNYSVSDRRLGTEVVEDVQTGTSYDPDIHKRRERDSDGFSLRVVSRDNQLSYASTSGDFATAAELDNIFYLDTLFKNTIVDTDGNDKDIYNLSADNKTGFFTTTDKKPLVGTLPYVVMKRDLPNPYSDFRSIPFYRETENQDISTTSIDVYNGDAFVTPMRYTSTMFYDIELKNRSNKSGVWNFILGVLSTIAGAALTIIPGGQAAGIAIIGFGLSQLSTGLKKSQVSKVYKELYEEGLRDTVDDVDTAFQFTGVKEDDEIQWFMDTASDLWMESSVNMNLRMGNTIGLSDFLPPVKTYSKDYLLNYGVTKLTLTDFSGNGGLNYQGFAKAELYHINKDYQRREREKLYFQLGLDYDCCSDCVEEFPHRIAYSEQSFQEELTDNYRTFLPNNYFDLQGNTGKIADLLTYQNNLYIHTDEALWHLPASLQERVTDDIVSFIGTGEFFSIPPRMILDVENGLSAGCKHKWATIKTNVGVLFVSVNQSQVILFNGKGLTPISSKGEFKWFKENTKFKIVDQYKTLTGKDFPYDNNPSNPYGCGYISAYDSKEERIIITKKDFLLDGILSEDITICATGGTLSFFSDTRTLISNQESLGWFYEGLEGCFLKFSQASTQTLSVTRFIDINNEGLGTETVLVNVPTLIYTFIAPQSLSEESVCNASWTRSYSQRGEGWTSFHSYLPSLYAHYADKLYSWEGGNHYEHNIKGTHRFFRGVVHPFIVEFTDTSPIQTQIWQHVRVLGEASSWDQNLEEYLDNRFFFFNKAIIYNERQCSGELQFKVKDTTQVQTYLGNQIKNEVGVTIVDRNERDWTFNRFKDQIDDLTVPFFNKKCRDLQTDYFIDKILNPTPFNPHKNWYEKELFRGKYLKVRLILDTFETGVNFKMNFPSLKKQVSLR